jgi:hypothetical protein
MRYRLFLGISFLLASSAARATDWVTACTPLAQKDDISVQSDRLYAYSWLSKTTRTAATDAAYDSALKLIYDGLPVDSATSASFHDASYFENLTKLNWRQESHLGYRSSVLSAAAATEYSNCIATLANAEGVHVLVRENQPTQVTFSITFAAFGGGDFILRAKKNGRVIHPAELGAPVNGHRLSTSLTIRRALKEDVQLDVVALKKIGSNFAPAHMNNGSDTAVAPYPWKIEFIAKPAVVRTTDAVSSASCNDNTSSRSGQRDAADGQTISLVSATNAVLSNPRQLETGTGGDGPGPNNHLEIERKSPTRIDAFAHCEAQQGRGFSESYKLVADEVVLKAKKR